MKKRKDKYDRAVEYLTKHPEKITTAWALPLTSMALSHELFKRCGGLTCGCLTQIRSNDTEYTGKRYVAATPKLTKEIRADKRIPTQAHKIKVADLPVFAEWQRRLDKELNRK